MSRTKNVLLIAHMMRDPVKQSYSLQLFQFKLQISQRINSSIYHSPIASFEAAFIIHICHQPYLPRIKARKRKHMEEAPPAAAVPPYKVQCASPRDSTVFNCSPVALLKLVSCLQGKAPSQTQTPGWQTLVSSLTPQRGYSDFFTVGMSSHFLGAFK